MNQVDEIGDKEIEEVLKRVGYGHLACARDEEPYVIPVNYVYDGSAIYIYTTEGLKVEIIRENPRVCLQVEEIITNGIWTSVVVTGRAEQITDLEEREKALDVIMPANPTLTPAISIRWMDGWVRENVEVIYRLVPDKMTGRRSVLIDTRGAFIPSRGSHVNL